MIETISDFYCNQGYAILSLVLAYERKDTSFSVAGAHWLARNILIEIIKSPQAMNKESSNSGRLWSASKALNERFSIDEDYLLHHIRSQLIFVGKFQEQISYEYNFKTSHEILQRIEIQAQKSLDFIKSYSSFPFFIEADLFHIDSVLKVKSFISYLQELVETLLIFDRKQNEEAWLETLTSNFETDRSENVRENDIDEKFDPFSQDHYEHW